MADFSPQQVYSGIQTSRSPYGGIEGQATNLLGQAQGAGLFDPMGSPRFRALQRMRILQAQRAARLRTGTGAGLYGLDPYSARILGIQSDLNSQSQGAQAMNASDLAQLQGAQDFYRQLLSQRLNQASQERIAQEQAKAQQQGMFGSILGTLGGAVLPGLFGGRSSGGSSNPGFNPDYSY